MKDCKGRECNLGKECFKLDPHAHECSCGFVGDAALREQIADLIMTLEHLAVVLYRGEKVLQQFQPGTEAYSLKQAVDEAHRIIFKTLAKFKEVEK